MDENKIPSSNPYDSHFNLPQTVNTIVMDSKKLDVDGRGERPQLARPSPKRETNSAAVLTSMISYICSVSPLNHRCPNDLRPHVQVQLNGVPVDFLIDTGASLSVISEEIYSSIENY